MQPKKFSEYTPITETDGSEVIPILKAGVNATVKSEDLPISTATQTAIDAADAGIAAHIADVANPHQVTKTQVGLGNADNTSDANKPVSTAQATAIALKADTTYVDSQDALKADQATTYTKTEVDTKDTAVADTAQTNLTAHTSNTSNPHSTTKSQVGLGNADNTSDVDKPISTATQTALDAKATNTALDAHTNNTSNPHSVTKAQVNLGSVDNTSDIDKPVSTAQATADAAVASTAASNLSAHTSNTSNPHSTTKAQVGLANADNTSDASKPVSTAQAAAIALKVSKAGDTMTGPLEATNITAVGGNAAYNGGLPTVSLKNATKTWDLYEASNGDVFLRNATDNLAPFVVRVATPQNMLEFYSGGVQILSNFIPRSDNTGSIGTSLFKFSDVQTKKVTVDGANIVSGTGFPSGVVSAPVGSIYIDKSVTNGASSWIKKSGTGNTGWKILEGDTGQRDITANLVNGWTATKIFVRRVNNEVYLQVEGLNAAAMTNTIFTALSSGFRGYSNSYVSRMMLHTGAGPVAAWRVNIEASGGVYVGNSTTATPVLYGLAPFPTLDDWPSSLPGTAA